MKRVKEAIKNARPTNPLAAKAQDKDPKKDPRRSEHSDHGEHHGHHHVDDRPPI